MPHAVRRTTLAALLLAPLVASATTAANTAVPDNPTLIYSTEGSTLQRSAPISSQVSVVKLLPSSPVLSAPSNQSIASSGSAVYNYTLTTTANGPETFKFTVIVRPSAGLGASTAQPSPLTLTLGATSFVSMESGTTISGVQNALSTVNVPATMAPGDQSVNGLAAGSTVVIDGVAFTIQSVVAHNNGSPDTLDQIVLKGTGTANVTPAKGDLIAQQQPFTLTVTAGANSTTSPQNVTVQLTATDPDHAAASASHTTVTAVAAPGIVVTKYVRNLSAVVKGSGTPLVLAAIKGGVYYSAGVTGNPGDTLEYAIHLVKTDAAGSSAGVVLNDPLADAVTYTKGSLRYDNCGNTFSSLSDVTDNDAATVVNNTIYFNQAAAGSLPAGTATCNLLYQVQLK